MTLLFLTKKNGAQEQNTEPGSHLAVARADYVLWGPSCVLISEPGSQGEGPFLGLKRQASGTGVAFLAAFLVL